MSLSDRIIQELTNERMAHFAKQLVQLADRIERMYGPERVLTPADIRKIAWEIERQL